MAGAGALYLFELWFIRERFRNGSLRRHLLLAGAGIVAVMAMLGAPVWATAAMLVVLTALRATGSGRVGA